ncbi:MULTISPECIES: TetR/AcrR family transcriptional regulator [unclassified Crossiella]|uniref:TetR/AcrR family transcriptional regulator n=1 Tax=unclassified Crossiella TaxID=2620835 RepID=UPI001FFFCDA0|nr:MULTISPECIES: TetR/AcrR family transcriptional regulator [unclassified Crossiella]MCK2237283.1 TetR/AcrR family transcriptional regulator [Crossiella sp. S99.2]MCK2250938.1 TetR/AcrR family transcriptional regulator [Crossiella sp. S99.1]
MADSVKGQPSKRGDARRERWKEHRSVRRAEFVEATIRALATHGPDVGMDEIAAEAGVTKPVIYRHFSDKADLYLAVGARATDLLMEQIVPAIERRGSPRERISAVIDAYLCTIEERPELYRFMTRRSFADRPVDADPASRTEAMIASRLARLLGEYMRLLGLDSGAAEPYAFAVVGAVEKAGDWWLERQTMSRENLRDYLVNIVWHAIDGFTRISGVEIDPDLPLDFDLPSTQLRLVREDPDQQENRETS